MLFRSGRLIGGLSYKATLARGYALVRAADGRIRRLAAELRAGERLSLEFSDGSAGAVADGERPVSVEKPKKAKAKPGGGQGSLF